VVAATYPANDSITIYWKGKDTRDGDGTQYRVLVHEGSEPDPARTEDVLSDWRNGYRVSDKPVIYDFMYRFKIPPNNPEKIYYYQVHARDARGSVGKSVIPTFSY
jgi:hypothetical protein